MNQAYWELAFDKPQLLQALDERREQLSRQRRSLRRLEGDGEIYAWPAGRIAEGGIVGWFREGWIGGWGARTPEAPWQTHRVSDMRDINTKNKFREKFRPLAPSILEGALTEAFAGTEPDTFIIRGHRVRSEKMAMMPAAANWTNPREYTP